MSYFEDIYQKRLNRYGLDYTSRVQNQREKEFNDLLLKSIYRVDFEFQGESYPGILNRYKQDETQTMQYLMTNKSCLMSNGTILMLKNNQNEIKPWMIYYLEEIPASGYNKYIILKMTHYLTWINEDKQSYSAWAYMYGQEDNEIKSEFASRSHEATNFKENTKSSFFVTAINENLTRGSYIEIGEGNLKEAYTVSGYDIQSNQGIQFVTVSPVYIRDSQVTPQSVTGEEGKEYFWLQG